jgi:hypothetical protein
MKIHEYQAKALLREFKPRLMCMTRMNLFPAGEPISVAPIPASPSRRLGCLSIRCGEN